MWAGAGTSPGPRPQAPHPAPFSPISVPSGGKLVFTTTPGSERKRGAALEAESWVWTKFCHDSWSLTK